MNGVNLFQLFEDYPEEDHPETLSDLPKFEQRCRTRGLNDAAEYLKNLYESLRYQVEREWFIDSPTSDQTRQ